MTRLPRVEIAPFGENGWIATFSDGEDDVATALYANAVAARLRENSDMTDAVAGLDSVCVRFDPACVAADRVREIVQDAAARAWRETAPTSTKRIDIPVCYGGDFGPDFNSLCTENNISAEDLVEMHATRAYRVLTIGFAPGFAYLGPLDPALRPPRLDTPRPRVAAGSVAVADAFTGVYSLASPGGWRIIGRTPKRLFDPRAHAPFLFEPGAEVRFVPIDAAAFAAHRRQAS